MSIATHCQGCGVELSPALPATQNRKWCSERCRKQTSYGTPCVDCGGPTNGSNGHGPNAPKRCAHCNGARQGAINAEVAMAQRLLIEQMWADGKTCREIAEVFGWTGTYAKQATSLLRSRGYNLPHRNHGAAAHMAIHGKRQAAVARAARAR